MIELTIIGHESLQGSSYHYTSKGMFLLLSCNSRLIYVTYLSLRGTITMNTKTSLCIVCNDVMFTCT